MFKGHPKGLYALALANTGERFGYYTMLAIFMLFLQAKFGWGGSLASTTYAIFLAAVYFFPVVGGILADKIGYGKCVVTGICVMFLGYVALSIPTAANTLGVVLMLGALLFIAIGTGLFKGNLQVLVGNLYDDPKYTAKRDSAFSLFYMAINIGAMFAPAAATAITNKFLSKAGLIYKADIPALAHQFLNGTISAENTAKLQDLASMMPGNAASMPLDQFSSYYIEHLASSYNMGFAIACVSLIVSMLIYVLTRNWHKHVLVHCQCDGLVSFNRNCSERHSCRHEVLHYAFLGFDLLYRQRFRSLPEIHKVAQERGLRLVVDIVDELFIFLVVACAGRYLQSGDSLWIPGVLDAVIAVSEQAGVGQQRIRSGLLAGFHQAHCVCSDLLEADASHRRHVGAEIAMQQGLSQTDAFKDHCTAIRTDGGYAHLGHYLVETLADRLYVVVLGCLVVFLDDVVLHQVVQHCESHIRIDG